MKDYPYIYQVQVVYTDPDGWEVCQSMTPQINEENAFLLGQLFVDANILTNAEIMVLPPESEFWRVRDAQGRITQRRVSDENTPTLRETMMADAYQKEIDTLHAENAALREALTPSAGTKAAYIREVSTRAFNDDVYVSWTAIKEIMAMIRKRSGLPEAPQEEK